MDINSFLILEAQSLMFSFLRRILMRAVVLLMLLYEQGKFRRKSMICHKCSKLHIKELGLIICFVACNRVQFLSKPFKSCFSSMMDMYIVIKFNSFTIYQTKNILLDNCNIMATLYGNNKMFAHCLRFIIDFEALRQNSVYTVNITFS